MSLNDLSASEQVAAKRALARDAKSNKPRVYLLIGEHGYGGGDVLAAYATLARADKALAKLPQRTVDCYSRVLVQRVLVRE
jgi:hypothetical protein